MSTSLRGNKRVERESFQRIPDIMPVPNLIEIQRKSYEEFLQLDVSASKRENVGLQAVFHSVYPISDFNSLSSLEFVRYSFGEPKYTVPECQERDMTFAAPLKVLLRLIVREKDKDGNKKIKDIREQEVFLCELPLMTERGTFIINGAERVIVSQLHRSPGVTFDDDEGKTLASGKRLFSARIIPYRGSWLEFEFDVNDILYVRIDRKRKIPITTLLRSLGYDTNEQILELFHTVEKIELKDRPQSSLVGRINMQDVVDPETGEILLASNKELTAETLSLLVKKGVKELRLVTPGKNQDYYQTLRKTLDKDTTRTADEALREIYRKLRPGDPPTLEGARQLLESIFFNPKKYDLARVGRYKLNQRLGLSFPLTDRVLHREDIIETIKYLIRLNNGEGSKDDIDHLGNRRVRSSGELLENQFRVGLARMEKVIREKMSILDNLENIMPNQLINAKPVVAAVKEFFGSSQLSQFMDQTNPLAELTHKRRLSALGPGGLNRDRAGFEVRDVHYTHYGRMCPIETPEGPNIGLIASLATYARINEFGFIETPYRKVAKGTVGEEIEFLSADKEDEFVIAQANAPMEQGGAFVDKAVAARFKGDFPQVPPTAVNYMDVSPKQLVSVATALIPFLEHDDANRALMGSNMQRQAVPLIKTDAPIVGTGMEGKAAYDSGVLVVARREGTVESVSADRIIVRCERRVEDEKAYDIYRLIKFKRSNQDTCINQKPLVSRGQHVAKGDVLADGPATSGGELALGVNVLVAFMPWRGYNFEDAIIISEELLQKDAFTSVHIEEFEVEARDTKLGKEEITRDIPNVGEEALTNLDEDGIIRVGAEVNPGDILVGKVTPKGETELTPEEKLLRAIFGEKAGDVRDSSLKAPPGLEGKVIEVKVFGRKEKDDKSKQRETREIRRIERERAKALEKIEHDFAEEVKGLKSDTESGKSRVDVAARTAALRQLRDELMAEIEQEKAKESEKLKRGDELRPGVIKLVKVYVAKRRKLSVGDKLAGRHGNKGVVSVIAPTEDMPFLSEGTSVQMVLNPLGVPSRMNVGQILETHLGWAAHKLGLRIATPVFDGAKEDEVKGWLKKAKLPENGKATLRDGRTGEPFAEQVTVGQMYMLKLAHLVDDKIHARSIGPYSLVAQQPLGGKAQFGGQRFGEMEVWALEAYGAAYTLQELLTVKSDDITGRTRVYEAIVKGKNLPEPGVPESFNVLVKELQALCLNVELLKEGRRVGP